MLRQGCDAHAHTHLCACTYLGVCTQVSYLQFKVNSKSSREFDSDGAYGQLSSTLRREIREDMCANHQCVNGATCVDRVSDYECQCPVGFEGEFCQVGTTPLPPTQH